MRKQWLVVAFFAGIAIGWGIHVSPRHRPTPSPVPDLLRSAHHLSVYRPRMPGDVGYELTPLSYQRGTELLILNDQPAADAEDVVLISFNHGEAVISCKRVK